MRVSEGFKKYAANTGYLFLEKIVRMIFMLTIWTYVARYLGPEQFGIINYALSFVFLFSALSELGLEPIVVRELVKDVKRADSILGSSFFLKWSGGIIAVVLIFAVVSILAVELPIRMIIFFLSFRLVFNSFRVIDYYFQARVLSKYTVFCLLSALGAISVLTILFVLWKFPMIYFIYVVLLESIITAVSLLLVFQLKGGKVSSWVLDRKEMLNLVKYSWPLILSGLSIAIYMRIDQIMLKEMVGVASVGYYSSAVRISEAFYFIAIILTNSLFPAVINAKIKNTGLYRERIKKLFSLLFWISLTIAIPTAIFASSIVKFLYGPHFLPAAKVLTIHIWAILPVFLGVGAGKWMVNENLQIYNMFCTLYGAVINVVLNLALIPVFNITGAAMATCISYFVAAVLSNVFHKKTREIFLIQINSFKIKPLLSQQ